MSFDTIFMLTVFAISMTFTPGPANLTLLGTSVQVGVKRTIPMLLGVVSGFFLTAIAVCVGLGELFLHFPQLMLVVKVLGSLYIVYLAWGLWMARRNAMESKTVEYPGFYRGLLIHPLNPKAWFMLISAYGQFIEPDLALQGSVMLIAVFSLAGVGANFTWTLVGSSLHTFLRDEQKKNGLFTLLSLVMLVMAITLWIA